MERLRHHPLRAQRLGRQNRDRSGLHLPSFRETLGMVEEAEREAGWMVACEEAGRYLALNRELMGATNPQEADPGTIRADFAQSIDANAVHGSDSPASAEREIAYFFASSEICPR